MCYDQEDNKLFVKNKAPMGRSKLLAKADFFFYGEADRTALLSNLILYEKIPEAMCFMMLSIERWIKKYHSRLFSFVPSSCTHLFFSSDTSCKSEPDSFIMVKSKERLHISNLYVTSAFLDGIEVVIGDTSEAKNIFIKERAQFCHLLQQTYWGINYSVEMIERRIRSAAAIVALKQGDKYIGFVRFLSNGSLGFISDMVIDKQYRGQGYSIFLFKQLTNLLIYQSVENVILTTPIEGVGEEAAPKVYLHFGFKKVITEMDLYSNDCRLLYIWEKNKERRKTIEKY